MARQSVPRWVVLSLLVLVGLLALTASLAASLNVDEAQAAFDDTDAASFTQEDANAIADGLNEEDEMNDEDGAFDSNEAGSDEDHGEEDMSFLENDGEEEDEDFELEDLDEAQAAQVAEELEPEERQAFMEMWKDRRVGENEDNTN